MKNAFYFIAGVLFITLISATTVSIITVKPSLPKATIIFSNDYREDEFIDKIKTYVKQGYVVKSIAGAGKQYTDTWIVVMEKY